MTGAGAAHRLSLLPRWMHRAWARSGGYFWLPCNLCGREHGGHEWNGASIPTDVPGVGKGICRLCASHPEVAGSGDGPRIVNTRPL
ncbi:MAG: hypothetical protein JWP11_1306 [Frankiales bacterium]|nr:hypothetical protein [Frankiales bacterium]